MSATNDRVSPDLPQNRTTPMFLRALEPKWLRHIRIGSCECWCSLACGGGSLLGKGVLCTNVLDYISESVSRTRNFGNINRTMF